MGTEINNVACLIFGAMLHLYTQKGEEAIKKLNFQEYLRGTALCIRRLVISTEGCIKLTSNDTYFVDSWFSSLKTYEEIEAAGVDYCGPVKTSHKDFCLAKLEKLMKD